jgi:LysM repeat protein
MGVVTGIPNVLAARYASDQMRGIWAPEAKVVAERRLWLAVLRAQQALGVDIPDGVVEDYERVVDRVDLESIAARERRTRHDVKARIEEFSALAGHEHVHKGMTSRDLTENVEQLQVRQSLDLVRVRMVATIARLGELAAQHQTLVLTGRSHNVPAQATTLGKRFATVADELLVALQRIEELLARYPLREARESSRRRLLGYPEAEPIEHGQAGLLAAPAPVAVQQDEGEPESEVDAEAGDETDVVAEAEPEPVAPVNGRARRGEQPPVEIAAEPSPEQPDADAEAEADADQTDALDGSKADDVVAEEAAPEVHTVRRGESLWTVAAAHGVSPEALAAANGLRPTTHVLAGQTLLIPS